MANWYRNVRVKSLEKARFLGYRVNPNLPLLDDSCALRSTEQIVERTLILGAVAAGVLGNFPTKVLDAWIVKQGLKSSSTAGESAYFSGVPLPNSEAEMFADQVESIWALTWILGKSSRLDPSEIAGDSLGPMLPDIEVGEGRQRFCRDIRVRSEGEILEECDLAYCLHWGIVDAMLNHAPPPGKVEPYVIVFRRKALEWVLSSDDWDSVSLDT